MNRTVEESVVYMAALSDVCQVMKDMGMSTKRNGDVDAVLLRLLVNEKINEAEYNLLAVAWIDNPTIPKRKN